jgi:hypothetical protein
MAVLAATGDQWQVVVEGHQAGQLEVQVWNFRSRAADTDVLTHLVIALIQCYVTHMIPVFSADYTMEQVRWKKVAPVLGPEFISTDGLPQVGAGSDDALPTFCAALLSLRTNQGGRSHRGRKFLPAIPEDQTTDNRISSDSEYWAALAAFIICVAGKFITPIGGGGSNFEVGVYSRKIGGSAFPYGDNGFTPLSAIERVALIATQRSRKEGRGA